MARLLAGLASSRDAWRGWKERELRGLQRFCPQFIQTSDGVRVGIMPGDSRYLEQGPKGEEAEMLPPQPTELTAEQLAADEIRHRTEFRASPSGDPFSDWVISFHGILCPTGHPSPAFPSSAKSSTC